MEEKTENIDVAEVTEDTGDAVVTEVTEDTGTKEATGTITDLETFGDSEKAEAEKIFAEGTEDGQITDDTATSSDDPENETAEGSGDDNDNYHNTNIYTPKASGKTTAVLFAIVGVLVALIVVFVFIIAGKIKKEKAGADLKIDPAPVTDAAKNGEDGGSDSSDPEVTPYVKKDYHVTVELGQYKGIEVDFPEVEVTLDDVNDELSEFLEGLAEYREVTDRPSQEGDTMNIDFVGYMDGEEFEGGSDSDVEFILGNGQFFPEFEDNLVGKTVGEYTLDLTFPDDYYEDVAGKPVTFVVTINSITQKWTPALTDELVAENTEYETVNEYKAYIEGYLMEEFTEDAEEQVKNDAILKAVDNTTFGGDIDEEIEDLTAQYIEYYDTMAQNYYGIDGATLFSYYGMDEQQYKDYLKEESSSSIKLQYMLDEVAKAEGLSYTQEEYDAEFEEIFISYYGFADAEEVFSTYTKEEIDETISNSLLREKAQDLITESAKINR